jgi:predicted MFS family arabinose efflux permease
MPERRVQPRSRMTHALEPLLRWVARRTGGRERAQTIIAFACVLGLDGADKGAIGAMADQLQRALHIGNTDLGLILTCSLAIGAAATLPFGWLVDRVDRVRLLRWTIGIWGAATALSGLATSYSFLLAARVLLGASTACTGPAIASLVGDYFPQGERGAVYGQVLSGEMVGTGIGLLLAGELATWTWRAGFIALAVPAALLVWALRDIPEPERGGGSALRDRRRSAPGGGKATRGGHQRAQESAIDELVEQQHVQPRRALVLTGDPRRRSLWWALRYVLRIPTNVVLVIASSLGYFYFTGLRAFGIEYIQGRFEIGNAWAIVLVLLAGGGAIAGVIVSGHLADALIRRGRLRARVVVGAGAFLASAGAFLLALFATSPWLGMPLLALAAAMLGAINSPLDAARLDIMVPGLWGRAESVRTCLRKAAEAVAPLAFGYVAEHVFGGGGRAAGLHGTFVVMLIALAAGGGVSLIALKTYERDVATAHASVKHSRAHPNPQH